MCASVCLRALQLKWKKQTKTFIIQLWDNKTESPKGYLDTENIHNNPSEAQRDRKITGGRVRKESK